MLRRTAFSANIKERRDYSCAVYDADGRTVAMGDHMPAHLGAMPVSVSAVLQEAQPGRGDIYFLNDPFRGGTHLPDITSVSAVFPSGCDAPALYLATRAHHADVGGMMPGSMPLATEIFQEGLRIPPIRLVRDGEYDEGLLALILANVRTPQERRGDLGAQVAAHRVGERRLLQALAKHGPAKIAERTAQLQGLCRAPHAAPPRGLAGRQLRLRGLPRQRRLFYPAGAHCLPPDRERRIGNGRFQRVGPADARRRERQSRGDRLGGHVLFPLLDCRRYAVQCRPDAAGYGGDARRHGVRCTFAGKRGGGQRRNLAADRGCRHGSAAASRPPQACPRPPREP